MTIYLNTFSIVAYDDVEDAWGVAVASKFLAAAAVVNWARAGAGAVATQAYAKVGFGPDGLALMAGGKSASEALEHLVANDPLREERQVGLVDTSGGAAAHTGKECFNWAGHKVGEGFTCQGNILAGPQVIESMAHAFLAGSGELADRLVAALLAGDAAGGDRRGKQSAGVLIVKAGGGYGGDNDRYLDLRVDDDPAPVQKLQKLVEIHHLFFGEPRPEDMMPITGELARELQSYLQGHGYIKHEPSGEWDEATRQAFRALVGNENLESRWSLDRSPNHIDRIALDYLRERLGR
jgi:uncharacterized Ntn-hydrolase superfamily protein